MSRMKGIEFLVRWLNFNDSHDSWEMGTLCKFARQSETSCVPPREKFTASHPKEVSLNFSTSSPPALHQLVSYEDFLPIFTLSDGQ